MQCFVKKIVALLLAMSILVAFSGCDIDNVTADLMNRIINTMFSSDNSTADDEIFEMLDNTRMDNGRIIPNIPGDVSDVRMTILDREYETTSYFDSELVLSMMQICYGYCVDGVWNDFPSENYDLIGIWEDFTKTGWEASDGSHIVKIGQYLLVSICLRDDPLAQHVILDSLNSKIQEPFAEYRTYWYYYDQEGQQHYYSEYNESGYGYMAENPHYGKEGEEIRLNERMEFPARYYIILDYTTLADDYELNVSVIEWDDQIGKEYKLTGKEIKDLIG